MLQRIENRLAPWKKRFLSKGGQLILIKVVLSSIPFFFMSIFKMPISIVKRIEKMQRDFFGGDGVLKRKIHSIDWVTVCKNKKNGGLRIGHMLQKNNAMLTKCVWKFGREVSSLWKEFVCARYGVLKKAIF